MHRVFISSDSTAPLEHLLEICETMPLEGNVALANDNRVVSIYKDEEHDALFDVHFYEDEQYAGFLRGKGLGIDDGYVGGVDINEVMYCAKAFLFDKLDVL